MAVVVPFSQAQPQQARAPEADPTMLAIAAAQMHADGRLFAPMDITSQAQKADMQKTAKTWPEGTSPEVRSTFDKALKAGDITKDQYNKAMRDPRQFQEN